MASLGLPFQGEIRYYIESSYGVAASPTTTGLPISIKVLDARVGISTKHKPLRGFDKPEANELLEQCDDYTFHLEYIPQCGDTLFEDAVIRDPSDCSLNSIMFYLQTNACLGSDQTIYKIEGAKCKTCRVSGTLNNEWLYTMDFDVKSVVTSSTPTGSAPAALSGDICAFNIAGSIQGNSGDLAYITNSLDLTIDNGVKSHFDVGSLDKQYAVEGELNITGSCDISLDEGGGVHLADVVNQNAFTLVIALGGAGCPEITLADCKWKSSEVDEGISGDIMKENAPFTGTTISYATV